MIQLHNMLRLIELVLLSTIIGMYLNLLCVLLVVFMHTLTGTYLFIGVLKVNELFIGINCTLFV